MITKLFLIIAILFNSFTYQQNAGEILKNIQSKFNSAKGFTADFTEVSSGLKGKFSFKKEDMFKLKTEKQEITSNGKVIWNYDKKLNRVVINTVENEPSGFSLRQYLFIYPEKSDLKVIESNPNEKILEMIPKTDELGFTKAKIYVDENYMLKKIQLNNELQSGIELEFKNIIIDPELSEKYFEYTPPKGSRIIDLR